MAVLEGLPGVKVTVQINGRDLAEYDDPNASEHEPARAGAYHTSTKYIECVDDAEFSMKALASKEYKWGYKGHCLSMDFYVDGNLVSGRSIREGDLVRGPVETVVYGKRTYCAKEKHWIRRNCRFSAITTVDDAKKDRVEADMKVTKDLGVIEVRIYRAIYYSHGKLSTSVPSSRRQAAEPAPSELAEKSLKGRAISHGTNFSPAYKTQAPSRHFTKRLAEDHEQPIAVFQFHYRSKDALQREMIIPRTPSLSPGASPKPEVTSMSRKELERLAQERLNQLQKGSSVKQERKPSVKREHSDVIDLSDEKARPTKVSRRSSKLREVVDLTDD